MPERVEIEKRPWWKRLEDPGPRPPAPPPSSKRTQEGASEVTAESQVAVTEEPKDWQDKISGATTVHTGAGEETGARESSGEDLAQQGPQGTRTSNGRDNTLKGVGFSMESRNRTAPVQEALVIRTIKNFKWEQSH